MIDIFKYCPNCGKQSIRTKSAKLIACGKCGFHFYITSYPTSAAILENGKGEILLVKRKNPPKRGFWDLPGGFAELDENLEESIARELKEELGRTVKNLVYIGSSTDRYPYKGIIYRTICAVYCGRISGKIYPADDVVSCRFFAGKDFPKKRFAFAGLAKLIERYIGNK